MKKVMSDHSWREKAACLGADPKIFIPTDPSLWVHEDEAKSLCDSCGVRVQCIDSAVTSRWPEHGYWGTDEAIHRRLRRNRKIADEYFEIVNEVAVELASKDVINA